MYMQAVCLVFFHRLNSVRQIRTTFKSQVTVRRIVDIVDVYRNDFLFVLIRKGLLSKNGYVIIIKYFIFIAHLTKHASELRSEKRNK